MGMLDFLSGGKSGDAEEALARAASAYRQVGVPTENQLTLPELEKYVQQGLLTVEQAQAVLQKQNAYDTMDNDPRAREASIAALQKMQEIGTSGGKDANSEAATYDALSRANQHTQASRASIMDNMAQRGIPTSLMGVQQQLAAAGQDAEQAHKDQLQAAADANTRALQALSATGTLGNQISGQQFTEGSTKAAAQNAIDQWNAANQTQVNQTNAATENNARMYNNQVAQKAKDTNTTVDNMRTQYNAALPQQTFEDRLQKANGEAGVANNQANLAQKQGEQNAGIWGSIIGAGATMLGGPIAGMAAGAATGGGGTPMGSDVSSDAYRRNMTANAPPGYSAGGVIPGSPHVPGNSPANDTVPARLSPGEVVVPRTVAHNPEAAAQFIRHLNRKPQPPVHHDDIRAILEALTTRRNGGQ